MKLEQRIKQKLYQLDKIFKQMDFSYAVIGATALLIQKVDISRITRDIDFSVLMDGSWEDFTNLKEVLVKKGFQHTKIPHRLNSKDGAIIDILPVGNRIIKKGSIHWPDGIVMNALGLKEAIMHANKIKIQNSIISVAPIPIIVMLKLIAFSEHNDYKHIKDILCCFSGYDKERRFELMAEEIKDLTYENAGAYLLGNDLRALIFLKKAKLIESAISEFESRLFLDDQENDMFIFFRKGLAKN